MPPQYFWKPHALPRAHLELDGQGIVGPRPPVRGHQLEQIHNVLGLEDHGGRLLFTNREYRMVGTACQIGIRLVPWMYGHRQAIIARVHRLPSGANCQAITVTV